MLSRNPRIIALLVLAGIAALGGSERLSPGSTALPAPTAPPSRPVAPQAQASADAPRPAYRDDELLVRARPGVDLAQVATAHGTSLRKANAQGLGAVRVRPDQTVDQLRAALEQDPRVAWARPMGITSGADHGHDDDDDDDDASSVTRASSYQWHLDAIHAPAAGSVDLSDVVVAVLDTGVAFENYSEGGTSYVVAESLKDTTFVGAFDYVNDDDHPNDDHQHGTHITSLIASDGLVEGVAPGVQIMPLKVLDATSTGDELALISALFDAANYPAQIINLSLTFSEGYSPSPALREALEYAHGRGAVMVAASGNDGVQAALYPAASPLVLSVGASQPDGDGGLVETSYGNISPTLDLVAPGGNLDDDLTGDGYADGLLAETINPGDPSSTSYWFYAGTSQAAALVSGAAAHLVAAGLTDPDQIARALQTGASDDYGGVPYYNGYGAGNLDIEASLLAVDEDSPALDETDTVVVTMLPYLKAISSKKVRPTLELMAMDEDGAPIKNQYLIGSWWGTGGDRIWKCKTDSDGVCTVSGADAALLDSKKVTQALAWGASVDATFSKDAYNDDLQVATRPGAAMFTQNGLIVLTEALAAEGMLEGNPLAIRWETGTDAELGKISDAYAVVDMVSGGATRPQALMFNPKAVESSLSTEDVVLDLDASGLTSDTLSVVSLRFLTFGGAGLTSDTLSLTNIRLLQILGSGLTSDTLSVFLHPLELYSYRGAGLTSDTLSLTSDTLSFTSLPLQLPTRTLSGSSLSGYAFGELVDGGGWTQTDGYGASAALMAAGVVGMTYDAVLLAPGAVGSERGPATP